jgi:hypothetical protein
MRALHHHSKSSMSPSEIISFERTSNLLNLNLNKKNKSRRLKFLRSKPHARSKVPSWKWLSGKNVLLDMSTISIESNYQIAKSKI